MRGRARHSVRAVVGRSSCGAHGVTRPTLQKLLRYFVPSLFKNFLPQITDTFSQASVT